MDTSVDQYNKAMDWIRNIYLASKFDPDQPRADDGKWTGSSGDTMVEAISMSSPSGHVSKRSDAIATERLRVALFGEKGLQKPQAQQPSKTEILLRQASELRALAGRGMKPRAYLKQAKLLEEQAAQLQATPQ